MIVCEDGIRHRCTVSTMSEITFKGSWPGRNLGPTEVRLCSYSKEPMPVIGTCDVHTCKGQRAVVTLMLAGGSGPSLFGRNWLNYAGGNSHLKVGGGGGEAVVCLAPYSY